MYKVVFATLSCLYLANVLAESTTTSIRHFDVSTIETLGRQIYEDDKAAARASDIIKLQALDFDSIPFRGWITKYVNNKPVVVFVTEYNGVYHGEFEVRFDSTAEGRFVKVKRYPLVGEQLAKFRARKLISNAIDKPCSKSYNLVILKDPTQAGLLVYAIAATTDRDAIVVGGHYRFSVSADGAKLMRADRLSRSCFNLPKNPQNLPAGATAVAHFMTHLVSSTPVETHVFLSLLHNKEFVVRTNNTSTWRVAQGKMNQIQVRP